MYRKEEKEHTHAHTHYINLLFLCGNTKTHVFFFKTQRRITHACMSACVHTHSCTGHFRGPQISGANAHTQRQTLTYAGHFRGPQISGASQTMMETGNKNMESIWSHICFLWRYECLYYSPLADSYILLFTPALLVSLQTSSKAIYLHG